MSRAISHFYDAVDMTIDDVTAAYQQWEASLSERETKLQEAAPRILESARDLRDGYLALHITKCPGCDVLVQVTFRPIYPAIVLLDIENDTTHWCQPMPMLRTEAERIERERQRAPSSRPARSGGEVPDVE